MKKILAGAPMFLKELLQGKRRFLIDIILQWLRGYLFIEITGPGTMRFFQICQHKNIHTWKKSVGQQKGTCFLSLEDRELLPGILRKTHVHFHILEKCGAPFFFYRYKKRKLFAIGAILCLIFLWFLSGFLWDIQIHGSDLYSPSQVQSFLEKEGLHLGYPCRKINCEELEEKLREHFPDIAWVSCEQKGTQFIVRMKDTLDVNDKNTISAPCDLVASKNGKIYSIITRNGTPLVKKGSRVKKGDVLISGIVHILDDFDAELETDYTNADGDIMAETSSIYKDTIPMTYYTKTATGKKQYSIRLRFGKWGIPLLPVRDKYQSSYTISHYHIARLGKTFSLPFGIELKTTCETILTSKKSSKKQARTLAEKRYKEYSSALEKKGIQIIGSKFKTTFQQDTCITIGTIHSIESIGKIKAISRKLPEDGKKTVDES